MPSKESKKFKVSIILPNYNSSSYISQTIKSVLNQSYKKWELIIVDDNSDKKTKKILSKYEKNKKIKIIYLNKNNGAGFCRNLAIKKSSSYYLAFLDSDDIWSKAKLKKQIKFMQANNYSFTYTNYKSFKENKNATKNISVPKKFDFNTFTKNTSIGTSTMLIKRKIVKNIRFMNTKICEDYIYKCKILKKVKFAYLCNGFETKYRIRKNSLQSNRLKNIYWIWKINKNFNKLNFFTNLISIFYISLNSLKKYGLK